MIKLNDKGFRLISILVLFIVFFFLNGWGERPGVSRLAWHIAVSLLTLAAVCESNRWLIIHSHRWFTGRFKILKRLLAIVPAAMIITGTLIMLNQVFHHFISFGDWKQGTVFDSQLYINGRHVTAGAYGSAVFNGFLIFWIFFVVYETRYHFAKLRHVEKEKEQLEKEKLKAELHHLKGMVNPHFLFNTLNSLSALISENPRQAEIFLDELTRVYRYLLRNNETDLTTLTNELQFIHSYFHLLKTRYGDGIRFITDISLPPDDYLLPPLTLQLLIENAVKHNRLMKDQPLTIHVFTTPNHELIVSNNIQKKDTVVDSTRVGLQNINAKYRLLQKPGITVDSTGNTFSVTVPLIATA